MRITTSAKLSLSLIGIVAVLFVSGPMLLAYGWQLVHGRDVTLNGLTLHLDRGWIVLHNSVVRIPDDIFYRDADVNVNLCDDTTRLSTTTSGCWHPHEITQRYGKQVFSTISPDHTPYWRQVRLVF
jgi:hypothetical protein